MKKLLRQEWKYYLLFLVVAVMWLCTGNHVRDLFADPLSIDVLLNTPEPFNIIGFVGGNLDFRVGRACVGGLLGVSVCLPVLVVLLVGKGFIFGVEKNSYGRDFLQMLPVKRKERICFHLLMDSLLVLLALTIYGLIFYFKVKGFLAQVEISLPWFGRAVAGMIATDICYLWFLLGIINLLEVLFVNGRTRLAGVIACMGMSAYAVNWLFDHNTARPFYQKLFGFLFQKLSAGRFYSPELAAKLNNLPENWVHKMLTPEILYQGRPLEYMAEYVYDGKTEFVGTINLSILFDFSRWSSFGWYALTYLVLGAVLAVLAVRLYQKQDLSKEGVYFSFVKYLVSLMVSITIFLVLNVNPEMPVHTVLSASAAVIAFFLMVFGFSTKEQREAVIGHFAVGKR